jgi:Sec-independent protein translocase protein TatA
MFEGISQPMHLLVIGFAALLFFGPSKRPVLARGWAKAYAGSKKP